MKKISFIQPSRNNLKYLKWSYNSIRKHLDSIHEICVASDFSNDGTVEWCKEIAEKDKNFKYIVNEGPTRLGHTILYDKLINEVATSDIVMIWHADMYACPGLDDVIDELIEPGVVVSATRIEPPLHPPGPEKIILDCGIEPEEFDEKKLINSLLDFPFEENKTTEGIFAPWAIYKSDFQAIGGHDPLFAPQSKEDSDIFNRFQLNGYKFIQTWEGFVYHMTCRGSRFADGAKRNPDGQVFMAGRETNEWLAQNQRSSRNFIRKWGHFVKHDAYMKPIIPHKYDIAFLVDFARIAPEINFIAQLEPWCSCLYIIYDENIQYTIDKYIELEQQNTKFNLRDRIKLITREAINDGIEPKNDIVVKFKLGDFIHQVGINSDMNFLQQLSEIIADSGEIGVLSYGRIMITIKSLKTYENELIFIR